MKPLLNEIRHNPLLWLLACGPVVFAAQKLKPQADRLLFVVSVLAIAAEKIDEAEVQEARQRAEARLREKLSDEEVASVTEVPFYPVGWVLCAFGKPARASRLNYMARSRRQGRALRSVGLRGAPPP